MTDRERWEDLGCGDGACVFRTPTGMHTNAGCKCVPRTVDYDTFERSRLRRWVSVMRDRIVAQERDLERLRQERYDALSVHTKEGLLASEWILRTGRAERELAEARRRVEELSAELSWVDGQLVALHLGVRDKVVATPTATDRIIDMIRNRRGFRTSTESKDLTHD